MCLKYPIQVTTRQPSYQGELRFRVAAFYDEFIQAIQTPGEDTLALMQEFVRHETLESWANGLEAGMKRASGMLPHGAWKPKRPPVMIKGTALANGRLRAVQPQA